MSKNPAYDPSSADLYSGEPDGTVVLTPNEYRVAQHRRDCDWPYVVTNCNAESRLNAIKGPASQPWLPVQKVQHHTTPPFLTRCDVL